MKRKVVVSLIMAVIMMTTAGSLYAGEALVLADQHKAEGIECAACHGHDVKAIIPNESCLECHVSYEDLGEQTKDMHLNPHQSPHFIDLECTSCHQGHETLNNLCQQCHGPISRH